VNEFVTASESRTVTAHEIFNTNGKGHKIDEKKVALWQKEIDRYANIHQEIIEL